MPMKKAMAVVLTAMRRSFAKRTKSGVHVPPEMKEPMVNATAALSVRALSPAGVKFFSVFHASGLSQKTFRAEKPPPMAMAGTATSETIVNALIPK